jgi:hypothetical protein
MVSECSLLFGPDIMALCVGVKNTEIAVDTPRKNSRTAEENDPPARRLGGE